MTDTSVNIVKQHQNGKWYQKGQTALDYSTKWAILKLREI